MEEEPQKTISQPNIDDDQNLNSSIIQNNNEEQIEDEISNLIKEIPLNNLNDYYDIETNLFKKRIEKLNLKFYWIYDSVLGEETNNILLYPYNKLFLILFKEISLYIEEILRLNKQLSSKNKNEKYYMQKINDYKLKEKDFLLSKHTIKNLQRDIKTLEKNNEKLKNEIVKINKKIVNSNGPTFNNNSNFGIWKNNLYNGQSYKNFNKISNKFYTGNVTEQGSVMSSGSNRLSCGAHLNKKHKSKEINRNINSNRIQNSSTNTKTTNISSANNNKDIIILGINQCEDEINNLNIVEKMLMKCLDNDKKKKLFKGKSKSKHYKLSSPEKYNNSQVHFTAYKKSSYNDKKVKKANKSLDYKASCNN